MKLEALSAADSLEACTAVKRVASFGFRPIFTEYDDSPCGHLRSLFRTSEATSDLSVNRIFSQKKCRGE